MKKTIFLIALLLLIPQVVHPHAYLIESSPEESAVLNKSPKKVALQFLGYLEHFFSKVEVYDHTGDMVSRKTQLTDSDHGTLMEATLEELTAGEYTVKWICISKDGHKQNGNYKFMIK